MGCGGLPEFLGPIRLMQQPVLMRRSEVAAAELERWCSRVKEEDEGGNEVENDKDPLPLFIRGWLQGTPGNRGG